MRGFVLIVATAILAAGCITSNQAADLTTAPTPPAGPSFDLEDLTAAMERESANVSVRPSPYPRYAALTGTAYLVCVNGFEAQAYEYPDDTARRREADDSPPKLSADVDLYWGTIGWWARGAVLLEFHHDPEQPGPVAALLDSTMGRSIGRTGFALGPPPDEIPLSELCP